MISRKEVAVLYQWAKDYNVPYREAFTWSTDIWNKPVWMHVLKNSKGTVRHTKVSDDVGCILENPEVYTSFFVKIDAGSIALRHRDPKLYGRNAKRLQLPLNVPMGECYMNYRDEKVIWKEGVPYVAQVTKYPHDVRNNTDSPLIFLMLDIDVNTIVEV